MAIKEFLVIFFAWLFLLHRDAQSNSTDSDLQGVSPGPDDVFEEKSLGKNWEVNE